MAAGALNHMVETTVSTPIPALPTESTVANNKAPLTVSLRSRGRSEFLPLLDWAQRVQEVGPR